MMPARMIREGILTSDRFLSLPDNTARVCYLAALLNADDRGNLEGSPGQLARLWRDFGVDSLAKATTISQFLADQDLIRLYESAGKQYVHVPRFQQRMRHLKTACPPSPWCAPDVPTPPSGNDGILSPPSGNDSAGKSHANQAGDRENDSRTSGDGPTNGRRPSAEVKRSEEKKSVGAAQRGTRLLVAGLPDGWREWCESKRPDLDPQETFARFRDHWIAQPGSRGVKTDWAATWRNWVRNERLRRDRSGVFPA